MRSAGLLLLACIPVVLSSCAASSSLVPGYKGSPYARVIPGTIQCEEYDLGGEGVAYHDVDPANDGTGCCGNTLRTMDGGDTSSIKPHDQTADGSKPVLGARYLGWIREGEWVRYTVDVPVAGDFAIDSHLTCAGANNRMEILSGDKQLTADPIALPDSGGVHTWMFAKNIATVHLESGRQVLTLRMVKGSNWNLDYLEFVPLAEAAK